MKQDDLLFGRWLWLAWVGKLETAGLHEHHAVQGQAERNSCDIEATKYGHDQLKSSLPSACILYQCFGAAPEALALASSPPLDFHSEKPPCKIRTFSHPDTRSAKPACADKVPVLQ